MAIVRKKLWKEYFDQYKEGKKYELRLNDFSIERGDTLILEEWDKDKKEYTGRKIERKVTRVNRFQLNSLLETWYQKDIDKNGIQIISLEEKRKKKSFDLRKGVDFIGVTCVFFCHDGKGNILMHKRSKKCRDEQGRWDTGCGSMEFGETFEQAVKREIKEEYCVVPKNLHQIGVFNVLRKNNGVRTHWIKVLFVAQVDPKKVKIGEPEKMEDLQWFSSKKLPKPLHSQLKKDLERLKKIGVKL